MAFLKKYLSKEQFQHYRGRYKECIRMLNGLEKRLEKKLPISERRWAEVGETQGRYDSQLEVLPLGWPAESPET